jgi:hypothetical protein
MGQMTVVWFPERSHPEKLQPIQCPLQWQPNALFPKVRYIDCDNDQSPPSMLRMHGAIPALPIMFSWCCGYLPPPPLTSVVTKTAAHNNETLIYFTSADSKWFKDEAYKQFCWHNTYEANIKIKLQFCTSASCCTFPTKIDITHSPSQWNFCYISLFFTTCFGHNRPSSGVWLRKLSHWTYW